jgi:hypothetical protein
LDHGDLEQGLSSCSDRSFTGETLRGPEASIREILTRIVKTEISILRPLKSASVANDPFRQPLASPLM